jgi:hypothetical protein
MSLLTAPQRTRLQTLYAQWERHGLDCPGSSREQRVAWAAAEIRRPIASFSDLTMDEAKRLIDILQNAVGRKFPAKKRKRVQTTHDRQKKGTEGRHDQVHNEATMAGPSEFEMLRRDLDALGWTQHRLEAYLSSNSSPLKGRTQVRTLGDANQLHWALKRILQRQSTRQEKAAS